MFGGFEIAVVLIYAVIAALSIVVLWRLVLLLPVLMSLSIEARSCLRAIVGSDRPPERRLLDIEDLLRLQKITPEEYEAKRKDILNDL
jgi:hypothetical protein